MGLLIAGADFACVLFLSIIAFAMFFSNRKKDKKFIFFLLSIFFLLGSCLMDALAYIADTYETNLYLHFTLNLLSFIGIDFFTPTFLFYVTEKIDEKGKISHFHARLTLVLCTFDLIFLLAGSFSGEIFRIEDGKMINGPLYELIGVVQFVLYIYLIIQVFLNRKTIQRKLVLSIVIYSALPLIAMIIELIDSRIAIAYILLSVVEVIIYVLVVREDLRVISDNEKIMYNESVTDNMTGLFNRRAYVKDTEELSKAYSLDFVYVSMDLDGLKDVNDNLGHLAGDELIKGASECMKRCFGPYGKVYRTGGDEFTSILEASKEELDKIFDLFQNELDDWHGELNDTLSVSYGYVTSSEVQGITIHDVSVIADKRMYEAKKKYYKKRGFDRKGQHEAYSALCNLYTKILKINITKDEYQIVSMSETEEFYEEGTYDSISKWLTAFGKSGNVQARYIDEYLRKTDINYLREYFKSGKNSLSITYERLYGDSFKQVAMELIPTEEYTSDNQTLFLCVKTIDK